MGKESDRFNVTITATISRASGEPFADETLRYHDMGYQSVTQLEQVWLKFHEALTALGQPPQQSGGG